MIVVYKKTFEFLIILNFHSLLNYYLSIIKLFHAKVPKILGLQIFAGGPVNVDSILLKCQKFSFNLDDLLSGRSDITVLRVKKKADQ